MPDTATEPRALIADVVGQVIKHESSKYDIADALLRAFPSLRQMAGEEVPDDNDGYGTYVHWLVYNDMHNRAVDAEHEATRMSANWAGVMREAALIAEGLRGFEHATGARKAAQVSENVGILRVATELRRKAEETQKDEIRQAAPRRVLTPGEYDGAWHALEGAAGELGADPSTMLSAVLRALGIKANEGP